jgi:hypothetical protein
MPMMADVAQEKQRISDQLAKIETERSRLQNRLDELEIAERVLSRFGKQKVAMQRRGRPAGAGSKRSSGDGESSPGSTKRQKAGGAERQSVPLGDATLLAVQAHAGGISADAVRNYIAQEFGLEVRPNHLGMALQRLRRAGRLEIRDMRWHALQ